MLTKIKLDNYANVRKANETIFAGTSSVVNDNNVPIVPQQFQTQTYYPPQGSVISDPNLATPPMANQQFGMMPMQQKSIPAGDQGAGLRGLVRSGESDTVKEMGYNPATAQMKKYGAQQISMPESLKEMGKTAASYILGGGPPSLIPAALLFMYELTLPFKPALSVSPLGQVYSLRLMPPTLEGRGSEV